ncbi:uncharacterized protein SPSK_10074 [Sporothrix schenckii 1099-18]|uniref:Uncharacterized protein n=1 Tax=Sporothrix schenckii 1099-18 TaxID=1397361 RepID=A0A0F2MBB3_SPOSC|nr:uncharacterized protein SPSK_10074 [Sporothrix schenckii 1099-18]KJR85441.1 hypothetical protein SPSK_10074 [Sporothrix schenckii 1099-18]
MFACEDPLSSSLAPSCRTLNRTSPTASPSFAVLKEHVGDEHRQTDEIIAKSRHLHLKGLNLINPLRRPTIDLHRSGNVHPPPRLRHFARVNPAVSRLHTAKDATIMHFDANAL